MSALQLSGQKRLSVVLLVAAAALAALLAYEWQQGLALRDSVLALKSRHAATPPELKLEPPFQLQALPSYARITDQPLFVASRTPAKQETQTATKPPEQFELTGIAQSPHAAVVLLRNAKTGKTERLKEGEKSGDGLELQSVKPDAVTLKQNGQEVTLDLHVALGPNPPATAKPPQAASAPAPRTGQPPASAVAQQPQKSVPATADPGLQQLNAQRARMGLAPCLSDGSCPK